MQKKSGVLGLERLIKYDWLLQAEYLNSEYSPMSRGTREECTTMTTTPIRPNPTMFTRRSNRRLSGGAASAVPQASSTPADSKTKLSNGQPSGSFSWVRMELSSMNLPRPKDVAEQELFDRIKAEVSALSPSELTSRASELDRLAAPDMRRLMFSGDFELEVLGVTFAMFQRELVEVQALRDQLRHKGSFVDTLPPLTETGRVVTVTVNNGVTAESRAKARELEAKRKAFLAGLTSGEPHQLTVVLEAGRYDRIVRRLFTPVAEDIHPSALPFVERALGLADAKLAALRTAGQESEGGVKPEGQPPASASRVSASTDQTKNPVRSSGGASRSKASQLAPTATPSKAERRAADKIARDVLITQVNELKSSVSDIKLPTDELSTERQRIWASDFSTVSNDKLRQLAKLLEELRQMRDIRRIEGIFGEMCKILRISL